MTEAQSFGIRVAMPPNDPLSAPHLLGESWHSERWYDTEAERDRAFQKMEKQPPYYRRGDSPSVTLEKIER
ncbi:MAG: hypothetical protein KTR32_38685 [Granulosicoccus sp.]|nr:hypothetical protein [Granulosicoccus sp.]